MEFPAPRTQALLLVISSLVCGNLAAQTHGQTEIRLHFERGEEAMRANNPDVASQEFREVLRLDPNNYEAQANLGVIAFSQANYPEAARAFETVLKLNPSLWSAKAFLGMSDIRLGRNGEGRRFLEESIPRLQNAKLRKQAGLELIRLCHQSGDLDQIEEILKLLQQDDPTDVDLLYVSYRLHSDLAARAVASLSKTAPESARMYQILAQAAAAQDDFRGAITLYRKALEMSPKLAGLHYELGKTVLLNSRDEQSLQEAQKEFEAELASDPADSNCEYALGEIYWLRADLGTALQHINRALELRPDLADAQIALAKILTAKGKPEEALEHLLEAVRIDPTSEVAHHRLALAYRRLGRTKDADRELAIFEKLRDSHGPLKALFHEVVERPVSSEQIEGAGP